jgi:hypothetical protein
MLLNRAISVQLVKPKTTRKNGTTETTTTEVDWDKIGKIAQETSEGVAKVAIAAYAAKKLIDTAAQIAVIIAKRKL